MSSTRGSQLATDLPSVIGKVTYSHFSTATRLEDIQPDGDWELAIETLAVSLAKHNVAIVQLEPEQSFPVRSLARRVEDIHIMGRQEDAHLRQHCTFQSGKMSVDYRQGDTPRRDGLETLSVAVVSCLIQICLIQCVGPPWALLTGLFTS